MATQPSPTPGFARAGRPPWRRSDVLEAWILLAVCALTLVGSLLAALVSERAVERDLDQQRVERQEVTAVLVEDANDDPASGAADADRVWAAARWTTPDGSTHAGQTRVRPDTPAGTRITLWTDKRGTLTSTPVTHEEAQLQAATAGALAAVITGGAVVGGACAARPRLYRRCIEQWDADWARADTRWGGKTG
ncbi:hypothetical protein [Streptomyces sp. NBC_00280]|uniref:Rv1733c family protein n=1 Tax=Streptomyces sp. NBC_00280 TaxID=2975699 RepID=UPI003247C76C